MKLLKNTLLIMNVLFLSSFGQTTIAPLDSTSGHTMECSLSATPLKKLSEKNVARHKTEIANELFWNKIARYGIKGAFAGASLFAAYKIIQSFGSSSNKDTIKVDGTTLVPVAPAELVTLDSLNARCDHLATAGIARDAELVTLQNSLSPSLLSWQWFKNKTFLIGEHLTGMIVAGKLFHEIDGYIREGIFHPGSIAWFVHLRTNLLTNAELLPVVVPMDMVMNNALMMQQLGVHFNQELNAEQRTKLGKYAALLLPHNNLKKSIFNELKGYADVLGESTDGSVDSQTKLLIHSAYNSLVAQMELVIGFIHYKESLVLNNAAAVHEIAGVSRYLYNRTNELSVSITTILDAQDEQGKLKKQKLISLIHSFMQDLLRMLQALSRIESENNV